MSCQASSPHIPIKFPDNGAGPVCQADLNQCPFPAPSPPPLPFVIPGKSTFFWEFLTLGASLCGRAENPWIGISPQHHARHGYSRIPALFPSVPCPIFPVWIRQNSCFISRFGVFHVQFSLFGYSRIPALFPSLGCSMCNFPCFPPCSHFFTNNRIPKVFIQQHFPRGLWMHLDTANPCQPIPHHLKEIFPFFPKIQTLMQRFPWDPTWRNPGTIKVGKPQNLKPLYEASKQKFCFILTIPLP